MGLMEDLFGGGSSKTTVNKMSDPGIFGASPESTRLASGAENILGSEPDLLRSLRNELLNPSFAPTTSSEQDFLSTIMDLAGGRSAARGLGAPTTGGLAQALAPALMDIRNSRVSNLSQALGLERDFRGQTLGGMMDLGTLAMPQNIYMPTTNAKQTTGILPALSGLASGAGSMGSGIAALAALCWVAEELYGVDHIKTHFARLYANTHDTWFTRLYRKHGKTWAAWLHENSWAKPIVQPIWDIMAWRGAILNAQRGT